MKIVFLGTHHLARIVLEKLIRSQFKPQLVITGHDKKSGRGLALKATSVKLVAKKAKIKVDYEISTIDKSSDLAILVAYGKIIPKKVLQIPKFGFVNIHPSLLPKYRGPSPIQSAILNADNQTGVSIMVLDEKLDHGPILTQKEVLIEEPHTTETLTKKLAAVGANLLVESLPSYLSGETKPKEQDHSKASYTQKITKADGYIDLKNPPDPQKLDRMIRAFYPWPGTWCRLMVNGKWLMVKFLPPIIPSSSRPTDPFLIQPEGKRPLTIDEFKNGYPNLYDQIKPILENLAQP